MERAKAEEALRKSEEKYRTIFQTIDEGFTIQELVITEDGNVTDLIYQEVNEAYEHHLGVRDAVGRRASELYPGIEQYWFANLARVQRTGTPLRVEGFNGDLNRWITAHYARIGGPESRLISAVFNDITERKQHEQNQAFLLRLSDTLRAESSEDGVANGALRLLFEHLRLDRCYIALYRLGDNEADFTHQIGNERVRTLPKGIRLSDFPNALQIALNRTLVIDDVRNTDGLTDVDKENMHALGMHALVAAGLRNGDQNPIWTIVAVSAGPRRWTKSEIQLIEEVTERTWTAIERVKAEIELRESEAQLKKLVKLRDEFIGIASHELNTPITSMKVYAQIVQEKMEASGDKSNIQLLSRLNLQIDRLVVLIKSLLETTRIAEGKLQLSAEIIDIKGLIEERVDEISRTSNHQFELHLHKVPDLLADRERIGQVLTNLLSNAIKYSTKGTTIKVSLKQETDTIKVGVTDQGYGIPESDLTKVFEKFYRVTVNKMDTYPGMGLGLYITSQIVERHGGNISVESKVGVGSTFTFTLPLNHKEQ